MSSEKLKNWFWAIFLAIPLFTGFLQYDFLPQEYDGSKHTIIESHSEACGTEGMISCEVADTWKDIKTGKIFHRSEFKSHRRYQAFKIASLSFLYGLIACFFYVWHEIRYGIKNIDAICFGHIEREKLYKKEIFNKKLKHALFCNGFISLLWFIMI
jgi:hypothetical protein